MGLNDDITARRREIHTDGYSMSIGEVLSMYRDGDLDIHPEFQRIFRWSDEQKSRLIESILLGIPVPTIFVSQREDGVWDVIDGVQRLSTILQFVGLYKDEDGKPVDPLVLQATEYLKSLEGYTYEPGAASGGLYFDEVLRRDFKRAKLSFVIIRKESDPLAKFDLFQRLNAGTELSAQEARNCLLVMLDRTFYQWVVDLAAVPEFRSTVLLSEHKEDQGFRQELVLRAVLHWRFEGGTTELRKDLGLYLTDWVKSVAQDKSFDRDGEARRFREVFEVLERALHDDAFRRWDVDKQRFLGPFSISAFEAITAGVGEDVEGWRRSDPEELASRVRALWANESLRENSGTGVSPRRRMPRLVALGREHFRV